MIKKLLLLIASLLVILLIAFYFIASSSWYSGEKVEVITYGDSAPSQDTLKVMTYNLGYFSGMNNNLPVEMPEQLFDENLEKARQLLEKHQPDIIGFQEIDFSSSRSWKRNQLDSLSSGYHQAYKSINWDKRYVPFPYWPLKHHFGRMLSGQAILSKFPLSNDETVVLEKPMNAPFYYNKFYLDRLVQLVDVRVGERTIKVINLHLEAFDSETREAQAVVVKELYEKYAEDMPVILMGDFNSFPFWEEGADQAMKTILCADISSAIIRDKYNQSKKQNYTFDTGKPYQMIDYILYNPEFIQSVEAQVLQDAGEISDHFPVMMKFVFTSENDSTITE